MSTPTRNPAERLADSMLHTGPGTAGVHTWLAGLADRSWMRVERAALGELDGWRVEPETGNLRHHTGKFFSVEGLAVDLPGAPVPHWRQPIINQPEIGILGILVREVDGVLHCLMQAKHEPGNPNGLQISPTVQATRSNYTRVHQGKPVPYLEHFRSPGRVVIDIRQSEQGAWFYRKRNRNMVVEVGADDAVEVHEGFRWLTLGQIAELMTVPDLVNMDARTVLACLPGGGAALAGAEVDDFTAALVRSADPAAPSAHGLGDVLSWITDVRTHTDLRVVRTPLAGLPDWLYDDGRISHRTGGFFSVVGVRVQAGGREVGGWSQPMLEPVGTGVIAFLVKRIDGVLHVLTHARTEPGYADVTELAPTVQCSPENYALLPGGGPRFLDEVLTSSRIRFDTVLSEEGGRFLGARNRYVVAETDVDVAPDDPHYRWLTLHQYEELLRHSFYVNIQARSLVLCLRSLIPRGSRATPR